MLYVVVVITEADFLGILLVVDVDVDVGLKMLILEIEQYLRFCMTMFLLDTFE